MQSRSDSSAPSKITTLSRSTRVDGPGATERQTGFDQTHNLVVLGSYKLGGGWEFGARFRLSSGNLVTPTVCNPDQKTVRPVLRPREERKTVFHKLIAPVALEEQMRFAIREGGKTVGAGVVAKILA